MVNNIVYLIGFVFSIILIRNIYKVRRTKIGQYLLAISILTAFWLFAEMVSVPIFNESVIIFLQKAKYISIIYTGPILFLIALVLTFGRKKIKGIYILLMFSLPLFSLLSLITNHIPYTFITDVEAYFDHGILHFVYNRGIGFKVHMIYSYGMIFISNGILVYHYLVSPRIYKKQSLVIAGGSFISTALNLYFVFRVLNKGEFDSTPISVLATLYFIFWGFYIVTSNTLTSEARALVVDNLSDFIIILDKHNYVVDANAKAREALKQLLLPSGVGEIDFDIRLNIEFDRLIDHLRLSEAYKILLLSKKEGHLQIDLNNVAHRYEYTSQEIIDGQNKRIGELLIMKDVTESHNYVQELLNRNNRLTVSDTILRNARESILILDSNAQIISANKSMVEMSGYSEEELVGQSFSYLRSDQHDVLFYKEIWDKANTIGYWEGEIWDQRKNGEVYPKWMSFILITDELNKVQQYVVISSDRSKLKQAENKLHHLAYYDSLTGLPNRTMFMDRIDSALKRARRINKQVALFFIDVDRFKMINDSLGHTIGDELLIAIAKRVNELISEGQTMCRLGGDEFTIIIEDIIDPSEAEVIAINILRSFQKPIYIKEYELSIMISIGIAIGPEFGDTVERIVSRADIAMYQAKESKDVKYSFISEDVLKKRKRLHRINLEIDGAFLNEEFQLFLQPQVQVHGNQITISGAEGLIRWIKPDGTYISPLEFIEVAENNGSIHEIGYWVIEEIIRINQRLRSDGIKVNLSVNVSVVQLERSDFIDRVEHLIMSNETPIDLTFEITESLFLANLELGISRIKALKELGIHIALDDFGTGFSSLSYLTLLPIDYLKIDKVFVDELKDESRGCMAHMILSMAELLNLKTVAEGIEEVSQAINMTDSGCDILQGYLYSKPVKLEDFISYYHAVGSSMMAKKQG